MKYFYILLCLGFVLPAWSQQDKSPYEKFGKITEKDLNKTVYPIDSNANAIVLSDIGESALEGNSKGWFSISFKRHRVVHILRKAGYSEADVVIPLYTDGENEEKLDNVKAVTYNMDNGKLVESKLDKSGIFREKVDKNLVLKKFTLPNVKEGCIIEFEYKVTSDYIQNLDPWTFQGSSPVLWSEYKLSIPEFFSYAFLSSGYHPFSINDKKNRQGNFTVVDGHSAASSDRYNFSAGITDYRWVMKDVPELNEESFTSALKNHIARIEFQLSSQNYPLTPHDFRSTWGQLVKELSESPNFGHALSANNNWLEDDLKPMLASQSTDLEKAKRIYDYVRDNFICTDHSAVWIQSTLKNVMKAKKGSVAEINLLLTAMLRYAGLEANPVLLSTTDHGYAQDLYPLITNFNYVVTCFSSGGKNYYLDASNTRLGFNRMLPACYNGPARIIDDHATPVDFAADSLVEKAVTAVFVSNDAKGGWTGVMNNTPGYYESYMIRNKVKENGQEQYFKDLEKSLGMDIKIKEPRIDSLKQYEDPVALHYEIVLNPDKEDIIYINPMFGQGYRDNPFKSAERFYPVEMPYTSDETFILTMEVPAGYEVDELPQQMLAKLDEQGSAQFEYRISQSGSTVSMRTRVKILRTVYLPDEYPLLREFFNLIVKKQNEQIVFKKKK